MGSAFAVVESALKLDLVIPVDLEGREKLIISVIRLLTEGVAKCRRRIGEIDVSIAVLDASSTSAKMGRSVSRKELENEKQQKEKDIEHYNLIAGELLSTLERVRALMIK